VTTENRGVASSILALAILGAIVAALVWAATAGQAVGDAHPATRAPRVVFSDTSQALDPLPLWGHVDCATNSRQRLIATGGDPHLTVTGLPRGDGSFRELTVIDGDDVYGERCELGQNDRRGPTAFYRPGRHLITQISVRLPPGYPLPVDTWQVVMQMKQAGPSNNSGGTPVIELDAFDGRWLLRQSASRAESSDSRKLWSVPAGVGTWTRFSLNVRYSARSTRGFIKAAADLNADGDFADRRERSHRIRTYTLKVETRGGAKDLLPAGRSIPSHLRAGIYHDSAISCPPPGGCAVDIDNIQVLRLPR
jgi:polysaccharide lyase-like protein